MQTNGWNKALSLPRPGNEAKWPCSSQTNMTVASTACTTYFCVLGVLFLVLEEKEEGVARGAVFLGTTFSSLYRVVGESGTWRRTWDKGRNTHQSLDETFFVAIRYELNFEGHSNKAVFSIQLMPRQYLLLYSLAFCSLCGWFVAMVTHITPIITVLIDCRPFAIPWDWAFQKLNNSFTDDFKIKHGHGFLALLLSQPGYSRGGRTRSESHVM